MTSRLRLAADVGGHSIAVGIWDPERALLLGSGVVDTPPDRSVSSVGTVLALKALELCEDLGVPFPSRGGVALPGMLDRSRSVLVSAPNLCWHDVPLEEISSVVSCAAGSSVELYGENDANCYALGEMMAGSAKGLSDFVLFTLGTGVGCGVVLRGRLLIGSNGMAGEGGHMVVRDDIPCGCGGLGHLEALAGADRVEARGKRSFKEQWDDFVKGTPSEALEDFLDALSRGIASAVHLLDPEAVVLGGGVSRAQGLLPLLADRLEPYLAGAFRGKVRLILSSLMEKAPLVGAAMAGEMRD
ncbi:transcriptional regulator/sugar kinase [Thermanaerovibrio velox DSM 12556]|uniref:Transcriptional regulator/sugar kinase n=1 Tax=Thermanaerovibrio velox DSM 12556 TaxID=926567 RepID=H0UNB0_9BACT|nr:ROK family protein [Thermanaerovibrio velox]EHM10395.1 transcriptional regulator/sugar kinase [Thermanaerovibrio velox DSM 12556]